MTLRGLYFNTQFNGCEIKLFLDRLSDVSEGEKRSQITSTDATDVRSNYVTSLGKFPAKKYHQMRVLPK
jgi:hypothetical protein